MRSLVALRALVVTFIMVLATPAQAQDARADWLDIELGKSVVLETPANATAIAITDPTVADVVTLNTARKIQVQGKSVGSTDLVIQLGASSAPIIYEITVSQDLSDLVRRVEAIVPEEPPRVYPLNGRIVVEGRVNDLETLEAVAQVSSLYDENFVNLMTVSGDHQVQLEVVFAEVSRTALREIGLNVLWGDSGLGFGIQNPGTSSEAFSTNPLLANIINAGTVGATGVGSYHILGYVSQLDLAAALSVLDDHKVSKLLAQPTIVALSGQQAEFLAGGELPIATPSGTQISITYKEYGVKLVFVPTVLGGDLIDMRVYVEVSEPDFSISTRLTGIEVPGFVSRKAKSHLRIDSGMTFAMAGLLNEGHSITHSEIPGLGRIPLLGTLFRYSRHQYDESELLIFVTPRLVRPMGPDEVPAPPGTTDNSRLSDVEFYLLGLTSRPGSREAEPTGDVGLLR